MSIDYKMLGDRIQKARLRTGLTQERFAEHLDVSVGYVSQIERGISKVSLERLSEISETLHCDISFLISGTDSQNPQYLNQDLEKLYNKLNAKEKRMLSLLLKQYITNR